MRVPWYWTETQLTMTRGCKSNCAVGIYPTYTYYTPTCTLGFYYIISLRKITPCVGADQSFEKFFSQFDLLFWYCKRGKFLNRGVPKWTDFEKHQNAEEWGVHKAYLEKGLCTNKNTSDFTDVHVGQRPELKYKELSFVHQPDNPFHQLLRCEQNFTE